jgi:hypothetical protein
MIDCVRIPCPVIEIFSFKINQNNFVKRLKDGFEM